MKSETNLNLNLTNLPRDVLLLIIKELLLSDINLASKLSLVNKFMRSLVRLAIPLDKYLNMFISSNYKEDFRKLYSQDELQVPLVLTQDQLPIRYRQAIAYWKGLPPYILTMYDVNKLEEYIIHFLIITYEDRALPTLNLNSWNEIFDAAWVDNQWGMVPLIVVAARLEVLQSDAQSYPELVKDLEKLTDFEQFNNYIRKIAQSDPEKKKSFDELFGNVPAKRTACLCSAIFYSSGEMLEFLLGEDCFKDPKIIRKLVNEKGSPHYQNPLHSALLTGSIEKILLLLKAGASFSVIRSNQSYNLLDLIFLQHTDYRMDTPTDTPQSIYTYMYNAMIYGLLFESKLSDGAYEMLDSKGYPKLKDEIETRISKFIEWAQQQSAESFDPHILSVLNNLVDPKSKSPIRRVLIKLTSMGEKLKTGHFGLFTQAPVEVKNALGYFLPKNAMDASTEFLNRIQEDISKLIQSKNLTISKDFPALQALCNEPQPMQHKM